MSSQAYRKLLAEQDADAAMKKNPPPVPEPVIEPEPSPVPQKFILWPTFGGR